jgi:antitoxin component YwqK of YwqJK toxin-antitoxin module
MKTIKNSLCAGGLIVFAVLLFGCEPEEKRIDSYPNGQKKLEYHISSGKKHGEFKEYYQNGSIKSKGTYEKGLLEGRVIDFYNDGGIELISSWENGQQTGPNKTYYENGNIKKEYFTVDGVLTDTFKEYYPEGGLRAIGKYANGATVDTLTFFSSNGSIDEKQIFTRDGYKWKVLDYRGNGQDINEYILPYFKAKKDTVSFGENYEVEICLGNKEFKDFKVLVGELLDVPGLKDTVDILSSETNCFGYVVEPTRTGENTISGKFMYEAKEDSLNINFIGFKHSFYVTAPASVSL